MAVMPYFVFSPTSILSIIGLLHGPDKTVPTPKDDWHEAIVDVLIPAYNEQKNITMTLTSLSYQTLRPRRIILIDDHSTDNTIKYAKEMSEKLGLEIEIITRPISEGKTPSIDYVAHNSEADVEFVLDADTFLQSPNYIERLVFELYQGVGIASASGTILPLREKDYRDLVVHNKVLYDFHQKHTDACYLNQLSTMQKIGKAISNVYREVLYSCLQRFIYHGQMVFFGSIMNPVGCAVAYRREYVKTAFDEYAATLGLDLTTSEDIFIGFSFADYGYRNIQLTDITACTQEPPISRLPKQIFMWSSSFLQSCFYFNSLVCSPFKVFKKAFATYRANRDPEHKKAVEKRKIDEAYRQSFGRQFTERYGRPLGWYLFIAAAEKISFPTILVIMIILGWWEAIIVTLIAEATLVSLIYHLVSMRGNKITNFFKALLTSPIRYFFMLYDLLIIFYFSVDVWIKHNRKWRK